MGKKADYYQDFLKTVEVREKEIREKRQKKLFFSSIVLTMYVAVASIFLLQNRFFISIPFAGDSNSEITDLQTRIDTIENTINSLTISGTTTVSDLALEARISAIEEKNMYLYDTILTNPDSAITPKILRQEQDNIDEKFRDLKAQVNNTNTLLTGIFITILITIITYIGKQIWGGLIARKTAIKE